MPEATSRSFLVIRLGSLGDLLHTLPAVAALRASFPDGRIDWVVEQKWSPLVELVTAVDRVIPLRRTLAGSLACVRRLRGAGYACAVDFQGLYKSALLAWLSGAERRIGFDRAFAREPGAARFYTERVAPSGPHVAEMNLSLALRAGARRPTEMQFPLRLPEEDVRRLREMLVQEGISEFAVVSPGGGWRSKCWPAKRYGALCGELWRRHGLRTVVNAGPGEEELAREVVQASAPASPLMLSLSLRELAALVAQARIVVAADTGPLHLAAALGAPVVALFGPTDPARNGPLPRGAVVRNCPEGATTYKRGNVYSAAMLALSIEQVVAAVECELGAPS